MLHKYFCDPQVVGRESMIRFCRVKFCMSFLEVLYFTTAPPMTATACPSLTPRGCAWRTRRSSQHQASCRLPSPMDMTTVTLAGCLTRLYGEAFKCGYLHSVRSEKRKAVGMALKRTRFTVTVAPSVIKKYRQHDFIPYVHIKVLQQGPCFTKLEPYV